MMEGTQDAYRQLQSLLLNAWQPTGHIINFQNKPETIPGANSPWARVKILKTKSNQRTISRPGQVYTSNGVLMVQVFTPIGDGVSSTLRTSLVKIILDALRGQDTPGGLFFMEVTDSEAEQSGHWFQTNVSCLWQYDERLTT